MLLIELDFMQFFSSVHPIHLYRICSNFTIARNTSSRFCFFFIYLGKRLSILRFALSLVRIIASI